VAVTDKPSITRETAQRFSDDNYGTCRRVNARCAGDCGSGGPPRFVQLIGRWRQGAPLVPFFWTIVFYREPQVTRFTQKT